MPNAATLKTAAWTIAILAIAYRVGFKDTIEGNSKFLGFF